MYIKPTTSYKTLQDTYQSFLAENRFKIQLITGEAGTGKTSLVNLFMDEIGSSSDKIIIVSGLCYIHSDYNIPYQPFKEILKGLIQDVTREEQLSETKKSRGQTLKEALSFTAKAICEHAPDPVTAENLTKEGYQMLLKSNHSDVTVNHSLYGLTLCRIYLNSGQDGAFLSTMEEVLTVALQHNERCYLPDLYLLKHRYYQQKNQLIEAAVYLEKATTEAARSGSIRSMNNC